MWRGEVRRGRAGQAFDFGEPGVQDETTAKSLAAGRHGPRQLGQIVKTKPLRRSGSRILDQSLEPREPALQATGRLSSPVRSPGFLRGGLDNPRPNHAQGHSRPIERLLRTLTRRARSRAGRIGIARFVSRDLRQSGRTASVDQTDARNGSTPERQSAVGSHAIGPPGRFAPGVRDCDTDGDQRHNLLRLPV
jgi:hypothetical protein